MPRADIARDWSRCYHWHWERSDFITHARKVTARLLQPPTELSANWQKLLNWGTFNVKSIHEVGTDQNSEAAAAASKLHRLHQEKCPSAGATAEQSSNRLNWKEEKL